MQGKYGKYKPLCIYIRKTRLALMRGFDGFRVSRTRIGPRKYHLERKDMANIQLCSVFATTEKQPERANSWLGKGPRQV